jgi:hypothetical protein
MDIKVNWITWLSKMFKEFIDESKNNSNFKIVEIFTCQKTGLNKAIIQFSGRHTIEKNIYEIVTDNELLEGLDKKTIRTLTYMATIESLNPDYQIIGQEFSEKIKNSLLTIKHKSHNNISKISALEISRNVEMIKKFSSPDANRIGYLAGVTETENEFNFKYKEK